MGRQSLPVSVETEVLVASKRRCALCFGIERDDQPKRGQIAHLNKKREDNRFENLAFLCFDHHDQFDSTTSQSKNWTTGEVKKHRDQLYSRLATTQSVDATRPPPSEAIPIGIFVRQSGSQDGSVIAIFHGKRNWDGRHRYLILGEAYYGTQKRYGPNMGFLSFLALPNEQGEIHFAEGGYSVESTFDGRHLQVEELGAFGYFGAGADFAGRYEQSRDWFTKARWSLISIMQRFRERPEWPRG